VLKEGEDLLEEAGTQKIVPIFRRKRKIPSASRVYRGGKETSSGRGLKRAVRGEPLKEEGGTCSRRVESAMFADLPRTLP